MLCLRALRAPLLVVGLVSSVTGWCADSLFRFEERFDSGSLNMRRWHITRRGDFQESTIDVVGERLRLRGATIGTSDDTVKFHGVRTVRAFDLSRGIDVSCDLDWNAQSNGCYLTAAVFLCPVATDSNPEDLPDWIKLEYIGVPPGRNARAVVATSRAANVRYIHTEGWPDQQRTGRQIGRQRVRLGIRQGEVDVWENGRRLVTGRQPLPGFTRAYLYLQMSTHSNYPPREIFFDNVTVRTP